MNILRLSFRAFLTAVNARKPQPERCGRFDKKASDSPSEDLGEPDGVFGAEAGDRLRAAEDS
jgi:hypothetical protein